MSKIHVCIVSKEILANIIPVLADKNVSGFISFAGDNTQKKQGRRLTEILASKNIPLIKSVNAKNSFDYPAILAVAKKLRTQLTRDYGEHTWVINLTGGTKLMSFALHAAFADAKQAELIYLDSQNGALRYVNETDQAIPTTSVIDLTTYLKAQNFIVTSNPATDVDEVEYMAQRKHLINNVFIRNIGRSWLLSSVFNGPASAVENNENKLTQPIKNKIKPDAIPFIEQLETAGLFTWDRNKKTFTFTNIESAFFLAGGWLEEYAYWCAVDAGIKNIGLNVQGYWDTDVTGENTNNPTNEFDLVLCHHNKLLVIECKTLGNINDQGKGQDIVNKIEALGNKLGGLYGSSMLLSSSKVSQDDNYSQHVASRLKSYRIDVIQSNDLRNLTEKIRTWMQKSESKIIQEPMLTEESVT